ncbi:MAG: hypothetical protein H5T44_00630 [Thermoplasmatales archaeon]|nr:hypothetical protein [Thermoplasmatales archaeon]
MKKAIILIFALIFLGSVHAEKIADKQNDVMYVEWNENLNSYKAISSNKPNIDIKEISYEISNGGIILKLKVYGKIENSDKVFYWMYLNTTGRSYYIVFSNQTEICYSIKGEDISTCMQGEIEYEDDTIFAKFETAELGDIKEFFAYSSEYEKIGVDNKWHGDWAPDKFAPAFEKEQEEEQKTKEKKGLPGFELIFLLFALALILWRKR